MDNSNDGTKDSHVPTSEVDMHVSSADVPTSSGSMPAPPAEAPAPSVHPTTVLVPDANPPAIHSAYALDRGSAASVETPKGATQAKQQAKRRGKSDGGPTRSRSRSEEAQASTPSRTRKTELSDLVQLL